MKKIKLLFLFALASLVSTGQTYFAEVLDDTVRRVIVADQAFINTGSVGDPSNWIETDYEAYAGSGLRKNYAGIGYTYNAGIDGFVPPKIHPSAFLVEATGLWDFYDLPSMGVWLDQGTAWKYDDTGDTIIVEVVQSHTRTSHPPQTVPALFSVLQFGNDLYWIPGEQVAVDDERTYEDIFYKCIQSHQTQVGWEPPTTPSLWENITISPYWTAGVYYNATETIIYEPNEITYECLQPHTAQIGWEPPTTPALWKLL